MSDAFGAVIGQDAAVAQLNAAAANPVHAYLFLGPRGSGRARAALGFAAEMLSAGLDGPAAERTTRLALESTHPDVIIVEAQGAALRVTEAEEIIRHASISPVEGARKIIVVHGVDAIEEAAIGKLLKVIEEPPPSSVFVLLAEEVPPEIITIASRCVRIEFVAVPIQLIETVLFTEGVDIKRAKAAAAAAGGDLNRARLLATDEALADRAALWQAVPNRLDGSGAAVFQLTSELREAMDGATEALEAQHATELEELAARVEVTGERGAGRADLVARHKREVRRLRSDELRFGLATLARHYRDRLVEAPDPVANDALAAVTKASDGLIRNPNEALWLQSLLLGLSPR